MPERYAYLTLREAQEAIRIDFEQYHPQLALYDAMLRLVGQDRETMPLAPHKAKAFAIGFVSQLALTPALLASLCSLVFSTPATVYDQGGHQFIRIDTGLEHFGCTRCGRCCQLDYHGECTADDVALWREKDRQDILDWVELGFNEDERETYRIWKRPGTPFYAESCPWLKRIPGDTAFVCSIHDVKPSVCRSYPGLRKHAVMTGCKGLG